MAEHTTFITIDPNGDTLLKLKDIRCELPEWIDEATRFAPPAEITESSHEDTAAEVADESDQRKHPEEVHFLVSSRQLRLVSTYFDTMFKKNFAESVPNPADGKFHIWATEWNPDALERLMNIAHARIKGLQERISLDELVEMALIVDYYGMHEAPNLHVKKQFSLYKPGYPPPAFGHKTVKLMFLSSVLEEERTLEQMTGLAMKFSKGPLQDLGLPLGDIPNRLEEHRQQAIKSIVDQLDNLIERLEEGKECCSIGCRASLLGTLILFKRSGGLTSALGGSISPPYYGTSLQEACSAVRAMTVLEKNPNGYGGRYDRAKHTPIGVCSSCDFKDLFDKIMRKVDDDLVLKLDQGR